ACSSVSSPGSFRCVRPPARISPDARNATSWNQSWNAPRFADHVRVQRDAPLASSEISSASCAPGNAGYASPTAATSPAGELEIAQTAPDANASGVACTKPGLPAGSQLATPIEGDPLTTAPPASTPPPGAKPTRASWGSVAGTGALQRVAPAASSARIVGLVP